jgi:hypothetical protein
MAAPHFLNVDLEIESKHDLAVLEAELGRNMCVLFGGPASPGCFLLCLEILPQYGNPDDTIRVFCSMLERLSAKARRAWCSAYKKEFDIGYDAVPSKTIASHFSLRTDTLKRMSNLGATLGVTFYYPPKSKPNAPAKPASPMANTRRGARQ